MSQIITGAQVQEDFFKLRALARLGATVAQAKSAVWEWSDMMDGSKDRAEQAVTTTYLAPAMDGGWLQMVTSAGGGFTRLEKPYLPVGTTINPIHVANTKTSRWWVGMRGILISAPTNVDIYGVGLSDNTTFTFTFGVIAAVSTTKFSIADPVAGSIISAVNIDTSVHVLELWNDGTNINISVDNETPVTRANTNWPTAAGGVQFTFYVAGAFAKTAQLDGYGILSLVG